MEIRKRKRKYTGHLLRMEESTRVDTSWQNGTRTTKGYKKDVRGGMEENGISWGKMERKAKDRAVCGALWTPYVLHITKRI